ncbi:MAG: hypothetical protein DLM54_12315 [Acidimicrobiales bacterium]|nr:MAG: hypothetical protein DLM54_12315 [Acidimicrobiales bacterium]
MLGAVLGRTLRRMSVAVLGVVLGAGGLALGARAVPAGADPGSGAGSWVTNQVSFEPFGALTDAVPFTVGGVGSYRGGIDVGPGNGGLAVVNNVGLEDYVQGIAEVPPTWPAAALEAQTIAARTYVLHEAAQPSTGPLHPQICATDSCQVYVGLAREHEAGDGGWAAAVQATAGQIVEYGGQPILAMYSSSNGGHTVAGSEPYLKSVPDPEDAASSPDNFRVSIPLADLASAFGLPGPVTGVTQQGDLVTLIWHSNQPSSPVSPGSGRPAAAPNSSAPAPANQGATGGQLQLGSTSFRQKINSGVPAPAGFSQTLPSDRFQITTSGADLIVTGGGRGHGIGLSQYGALGKAVNHQSASQILADYYGGLRPSAPGHLAPSVRVGLADGKGQVSVGGPTPFRVLDGQGHALAVATTGTWQVGPGPRAGTVKVTAAPGQGGTPSLDSLAVGQLQPGQPARVKFRLSAPAAVTATEQGPPGQAPPVDAGVLAAGPSTVTVPTPTVAGMYRVTLTADAGGGRATTVALSYRVGSPAVTSGTSSDAGSQAGLSIQGRAQAIRIGRAAPNGSGGDRLPVALVGLGALGLAGAAVATRARRDRRLRRPAARRGGVHTPA